MNMWTMKNHNKKRIEKRKSSDDSFKLVSVAWNESLVFCFRFIWTLIFTVKLWRDTKCDSQKRKLSCFLPTCRCHLFFLLPANVMMSFPSLWNMKYFIFSGFDVVLFGCGSLEFQTWFCFFVWKNSFGSSSTLCDWMFPASPVRPSAPTPSLSY